MFLVIYLVFNKIICNNYQKYSIINRIQQDICSICVYSTSAYICSVILNLMYSRLLTSLMPLTLSAGCLVLRAEPVLDFSQAIYLDSLAEISFAEGDIERCTALWREAASIAEESAVTEEDSLNHSGFLQPLGVCCHRMSMMDSTLSPTVRCTVMSLRATPCSPMRADIAIMESYPCRRQLCGGTALSLVTVSSASPVIRPSVGKSPGRIQNKYS